MDSELCGRNIFGHINGKFNRVTETEKSMVIEELKRLMIKFNIVKIDICYSPDVDVPKEDGESLGMGFSGDM